MGAAGDIFNVSKNATHPSSKALLTGGTEWPVSKNVAHAGPQMTFQMFWLLKVQWCDDYSVQLVNLTVSSSNYDFIKWGSSEKSFIFCLASPLYSCVWHRNSNVYSSLWKACADKSCVQKNCVQPSRLGVWRQPADSHHFVQLTTFLPPAHFIPHSAPLWTSRKTLQPGSSTFGA